MLRAEEGRARSDYAGDESGGERRATCAGRRGRDSGLTFLTDDRQESDASASEQVGTGGEQRARVKTQTSGHKSP